MKTFLSFACLFASFGAWAGDLTIVASSPETALPLLRQGSAVETQLTHAGDSAVLRASGLVPGKPYAVMAVASPAKADPELFVRALDGALIRYNDDMAKGQMASMAVFVAPPNGQIVLTVRLLDTGTGSILVRLDQILPMQIGKLVSGETSRPQPFIRAIDLKAGATVHFDVRSPEKIDTVAILLDEEGNQVSGGDDREGSLDPLFSFTPVASKTYYLVVLPLEAGESAAVAVVAQPGRAPVQEPPSGGRPVEPRRRRSS